MIEKLKYLIENESELDIVDKKFSNEKICDFFVESGFITNIIFEDSHFENFEIHRCNFSNCYFINGEFRDGLWYRCDFSNCVFKNTTFTDQQFGRLFFNGSTLSENCQIKNLSLRDTKFYICKFLDTQWINIFFKIIHLIK